ncbi:N-acetyltransferase [Photobacterium frigidiphilum]|uniref:N-acetyltransferase n=1 Tax=Photobacterium frigidiphilum TaxID=264736 RepID=A0A2T3J6E5_9GAMM|nr:GNAT family N-acetyltransferase [Photobacterium frigidiphilum]PSU43237.1 N-acetyltransferase [Photobacterium frigidiphilum]
MGNCRYSLYSHDGESISLINSYDIWADVVLNAAGLNFPSVKDDIYIVDHYALEGDDDVFVVKPSQSIKSTGHRRQCYLDDLYLTPINLLEIGELAEVLPIPESNLVLASLGDAKPVLDELLHQGEDKQLNAQFCDMAAMRYSPITRFLEPNNDVCLQLYLKGRIVAIASFSRYVEDHRFPFSKHEISYELALHTVFVKPEYRNIGLATSLSKAIIAIAKHDMKKVQKVLSVGNLRLSPWFSAIALSAGGEAICDQISEAFVEANEDVFDELEEKGLKVTYQEPVICVESLV